MDIMIDIETMGARPNAAVASLGAVAFNSQTINTPDTIPESQRFYARLDLAQQNHRHYDGETIYWWLEQEEAARKALIVNNHALGLKTVLEEFVAWVKTHHNIYKDCVWCYGATFDHVILRTLFRDLGVIYPFIYRRELCMRTVVRLVPDVQCPQLPDLVGHNAVDDALRQAIWLQHCLKELQTY